MSSALINKIYINILQKNNALNCYFKLPVKSIVMFRGNFWRGNPVFRPPFMKNRPPRPMMPPPCPPFPPNPYSLSAEPRARNVKCGELRVHDVGNDVEIAGRIQNLRLNRFIVLRDETGITQLVAPDERIDLQKKMSRMPLDSYVRVRGEVIRRPMSSRNDSMPTGDVEVLIREFITVQHKRKQTDVDEDERSAKRAMRSKPGALKLTTEEVARAETPQMRSYFAARSLTCGDLTSDAAQPGDEISLCGWVLTKRPPLFIVLKDGHGMVQLVPSTAKPEMTQKFKDVVPNTIIFIKGILARRPFGQGNMRHQNGMMEVSVTELTPVDKNSPSCEGETTTQLMTTTEKQNSPIPEPVKVEESDALLNRYTGRSHTCGELRSSHVGETVTLMGWLEFVRLTKFLILRDSYGSTQILISDSDVESNKLLNNLSLESIIKVTGTVCNRPTAQIKEDSSTGEIEVLASSVTVLNEAKKSLPFNIRDYKKARESLRLQHRYLDLRFKEIQNNLRVRSQVLMKMRQFLINQHGFVEVETPTLFKKTPGGAREFVVPTHSPGLYYSLVQSPQQLKQLLMVGAMDRYFQVARCYRDETTRPDRQPEFTQLDIELSFCTQEDVMKLIEDLLVACWPNDHKVETPFPRLTYGEAMETYGSDKPDLRYDWKLANITETFVTGASENSKINLTERISEENFAAYYMIAPKSSVVQKTCKKTLEENLKEKFPLITPFVLSKNMEERLELLFGQEIATALSSKLDGPEDNVLFLAIGNKQQVLESGGSFRVQWADLLRERGLRLNANAFKFLWITDFPLFTKGENGKPESTHHPFTAPNPNQESVLFTEPLKVMGLHYDLVINGSEVGGGSIRIHNGDLQEKVLKNILDIPVEELQHLLEALRCGAPPHGGIALGIDRLISIMVGASSIRDVIAFPKGVEGKDPLTGAPSALNEDDLKYYHQKKDDEKVSETGTSSMET